MGVKMLKRIAMLSVIIIIFLACSSDDESPSDNDLKREIENVVTGGTWFISLYLDDNEDETSNYNGYEFSFGGDGVLTAVNGLNTFTGTWSISDDDDDSQSPYDFVIQFSGPEDLEELSDDWDIVSYNSSTIQLLDISGGDESTDYLTFRRL